MENSLIPFFYFLFIFCLISTGILGNGYFKGTGTEKLKIYFLDRRGGF